MPLARYFLYVGGVLLTLLFILDAYLTKIPFADRADPNLPVIRIHSDRKWPDRVVFDTSLPTVPPMRTTIVEDRVPSPPARQPRFRLPRVTSGLKFFLICREMRESLTLCIRSLTLGL